MKLSKTAGALALLASSAAFAVPVTIQFSGALANSGIDGYTSGTPLTGQISYDTNTLPAVSFPLGQGVTLTTYSVTQPNAFQMQVGGNLITNNQLTVSILDNGGGTASGEAISFEVDNVSFNGEPSTGYVLLTLQGAGTQHVLTGQLPAVINQNDFNSPGAPISGTLFSSTDASAKTADINVANLTTVSAVPETSSAVAMLAGLIALGGLMRQRRVQGPKRI